MRFLVYLTTLLLFSVAAAQSPTILQGDYISNVFGNSNFVLNPNAQTSNCTTSGTITCANVTVSSASITRSTTTPLVARTEFLMTTSTATGFADWALRTFDQGMKGQNCEARFTYKGFTVGTTTAQIHQGSNVVAQLTLTPSATDPRIASINFPCGDLSQVTKFRLQQATASLTGTNEIGGIYIGLATNMANVAQAQAIFRANDTNGASVPNATPTNVIFPTTIFDADGGYNSTTGTYTIRRAGRYLVHARVAFGMVNPYPSSIDNYIQVMKNNTSVATGFWSTGGAYGQYPNPQITSIVDFNVGDQINIAVQQATGAARNLLGGNALWSDFTLSRFPSSSELVVTPERQNTWAGVTYSRTADSIAVGGNAAAPTGYNIYSDSAWNTGKVTYGKCQATDVDANRIGCKIPSMPVGAYKMTVTGLLYEAATGSGNVICSYALYESTTNNYFASTTNFYSKTDGGVVYNGRTITGIFNNTAVADRNFLIAANKTYDTTAGASGNCQAFVSNSGGDISNFNIIIEPLDQPSNSALYVEGPVKASATGAAIPSGYQGEALSTTETITSSVSSGAWRTGAGLTLQPGVYLIFARTSIAAVAPTDIVVGITDQPNTSPINDSLGFGITSGVTDAGNTCCGLLGRAVGYFRVTTTKTFYPTGIVYSPVSSGYQFSQQISAVRLN